MRTVVLFNMGVGAADCVGELAVEDVADEQVHQDFLLGKSIVGGKFELLNQLVQLAVLLLAEQSLEELLNVYPLLGMDVRFDALLFDNLLVFFSHLLRLLGGLG
jgi:hypothetical protein